MAIYTVGQAAKILSVSDYALRMWLRDGVIKGSKIGAGRLWRITDESISEFMKSSEQNTSKIS